jgi:hypothetical protein
MDSHETEKAAAFTEEDLVCWPYHAAYLIQILNGEYSVEAAREDLAGLVGSKWDSRTSGKEL